MHMGEIRPFGQHNRVHPVPSVEHVRANFRYDCETGEMQRMGARGGWLDAQTVQRGMRSFAWRVDGRVHNALVHRLAFVLVLGRWPEGFVDHIDGDPSNNRWSNLRDVSPGNNQRARRDRGFSGRIEPDEKPHVGPVAFADFAAMFGGRADVLPVARGSVVRCGLPDLARLRELFQPDFEGGSLVRLKAVKHGRVGSVIRARPGKRLQFSIDGSPYLLHRILWWMAYGVMPEVIDHIDGDPGNNALSNLRSVDHSENARNRSSLSTSASRLTGVRWRRDRCAWEVKSPHVSGRYGVSIGFFSSLDEARAARRAALDAVGYHENHDRCSPEVVAAARKLQTSRRPVAFPNIEASMSGWAAYMQVNGEARRKSCVCFGRAWRLLQVWRAERRVMPGQGKFDFCEAAP